MSFTIFHAIDNIGLGGAQSMMCELYHAINTYYPQYSPHHRLSLSILNPVDSYSSKPPLKQGRIHDQRLV